MDFIKIILPYLLGVTAWGGTIAISDAIDNISQKKLVNKLDNHNYRLKGKKENAEKRFMDAVFHLIPLINIYISNVYCRFLDDKKMFEDFLKDSEEEGLIEKIMEKDGTPRNKPVIEEIDRPLLERIRLEERCNDLGTKPKPYTRKREIVTRRNRG